MEAKGPSTGVADEGGWWPNFASNEDASDTSTKAIEASGHRAGEDVFISLDIAANESGDASGYTSALDDRRLSGEEMGARIVEWTGRYPILSVEDPAGQDDWATMAAVTAAIGDRVQAIGDDVMVTNADRVARAGEAGVCNAASIKVNQVGTVTEAKAASDAAQARESSPIADFHDAALIGFEPEAGFADAYSVATSFARAARRRGVTIRENVAVHGSSWQGGRVTGVAT
ncbi:hypothetical protein OY671_009073, partial [Metschnikowia pulcherrima]